MGKVTGTKANYLLPLSSQAIEICDSINKKTSPVCEKLIFALQSSAQTV